MATLTSAALLTSAVGSILGVGVQTGAAMVGGGASSASPAVGGTSASARIARGSDGVSMGYFVVSLFRRVAGATVAAGAGAGAGSAGSSGSLDDNGRASAEDAAEAS